MAGESAAGAADTHGAALEPLRQLARPTCAWITTAERDQADARQTIRVPPSPSRVRRLESVESAPVTSSTLPSCRLPDVAVRPARHARAPTPPSRRARAPPRPNGTAADAGHSAAAAPALPWEPVSVSPSPPRLPRRPLPSHHWRPDVLCGARSVRRN